MSKSTIPRDYLNKLEEIRELADLKPRSFTQNCPIKERTADGTIVGRCFYYMKDGKTCPRHDDVSAAVKHYIETGKLTNEE